MIHFCCTGHRAQRVILVIAFVLMSYCSAVAGPRDEIMPIREIKAGMKGLGKTVIRGHSIETFNVEVLGILSNNKINENMVVTGNSILVRVSGKIIDESGGIAAGMSGSPVYVNGRIIGGLSSGWVMTDHTVGMVTPIEEMMEIWNYPQTSALPAKRGEALVWRPTGPMLPLPDGTPVTRIVETDDPVLLARLPIRNITVFRRCGSPIIVQGLSENAHALLRRRLHAPQLQGVQTPTAVQTPALAPTSLPTPAPVTSAVTPPPTTTNPTTQLEPGSAIGIQLARGDINVTTLGTLTFRDNKRVLGLAHPFLKKGRVTYFLTGAEIHHSFSSLQMPFKVGAPTDLVGCILQDREKGVAGELGRFPPALPVKLEVADLDLGKSKVLNYQVVRDPDLMASVIESTMLQAIESVIDRNGEGTATLNMVLGCAGRDSKSATLRRNNLIVSKSDITTAVIGQVLDNIGLVLDNEIEDAVPTELSLNIAIEKKRRTATIEKVEVKDSAVTPGGLLEVWITLRPFREAPIIKKAKITVPQDIGKESLRLLVYGRGNLDDEESAGSTAAPATSGTGTTGGASGSGSGSAKDRAKTDKGSDTTVEERASLSQVLSAASTAPANSDIILQFRQDGEDDLHGKGGAKNTQVLPTPYFILGNIENTISLSED